MGHNTYLEQLLKIAVSHHHHTPCHHQYSHGVRLVELDKPEEPSIDAQAGQSIYLHQPAAHHIIPLLRLRPSYARHPIAQCLWRISQLAIREVVVPITLPHHNIYFQHLWLSLRSPHHISRFHICPHPLAPQIQPLLPSPLCRCPDQRLSPIQQSPHLHLLKHRTNNHVHPHRLMLCEIKYPYSPHTPYALTQNPLPFFCRCTKRKQKIQ